MSDPAIDSSRDSIVAVAPPDTERRHGGPPHTGPEVVLDAHHAALTHPVGRRLAILTLTALGVVYGDIGTSPLYTLKEAFGASHGLAPSAVNVYGILSLVFWSIMLVVVVKYLVFILRADNHGEGGVLALLALVLQRQHRSNDRRRRKLFVILGVFGTALLFGDGIITPAISVLGAVEGIEIATPALSHFVVPITIGILLLLFMVQRFGTAQGRPRVRSDHADLVPRHRRARTGGDPPRAAHPRGRESVVCGALLLASTGSSASRRSARCSSR